MEDALRTLGEIPYLIDDFLAKKKHSEEVFQVLKAVLILMGYKTFTWK